MITVKTWCLPKLSEEQLENLHISIVKAAISIPEVGILDESQMLNLFPTDMMSYGLGTEIIVEVSKVPLSCDLGIRNKLAQAIVTAIRNILPETRTIECDVLPINKDAGHYIDAH